MNGDRYRVQSVGRAFDIVELIAKAGKDGARLTDLALAVGVTKAAAYAILLSLKAAGIISDTGEGMGKRYRLGLALVRLGDLAVAGTGVAEAAMPVLRQLTQATGITSRVAIWDEDAAVVVGRADAPDAIRFDAALGRRERPHCSAVGKVFLAAMPRQRAIDILERVGFPARTPRTLSTMPALTSALDKVASVHYAIDDEEDHIGIACVAAAIFGHDGAAIGAISITTLKQLLPDDAVPALTRSLVDHADRISVALGGLPASVAWRSRA
ncbi:MAG: IclR family transcriptional regulator [Mesorhizobium sp.]|uniref:IclR family transcriptional regulator n=1 Tax=Mesorhizobium sp. TaxID=1871066 RepID=UPI001ACC36BA|nr:IclR family transcriptional regulator [Mesorhizobium sp.]MBN9219918.1 IclR family transcriptional regulator [Mesorhizobium sp.]